MEPAKFDLLSTEITEYGSIRNSIMEIEAVTAIEADQQGLIGGMLRPDKFNDSKEIKLNLDFKILNWNKEIFIGL